MSFLVAMATSHPHPCFFTTNRMVSCWEDLVVLKEMLVRVGSVMREREGNFKRARQMESWADLYNMDPGGSEMRGR